MKKHLWVGMAVLAGVLAFAGCGEKKAAAPAAQAEKPLEVGSLGMGAQAKICPVSGDKIGGDMGKPYIYTMADGKKITLCCPSCRKTIDKDPRKYAAFFY